jgi:transcriptional regulator with XRE-family HTH domain
MLDQESAPFGLVLLHFRAAAGLTQEALAERARLRPGTIAALEHGRRRVPRSTTVALLADALLLDEHDRDQLMRAARASAVGGAAEDSQLAVPQTANTSPKESTSSISLRSAIPSWCWAALPTPSAYWI